MHTQSPLVLEKSVAEFIQRNVSVSVGTRNARNIPAVARGVGCKVAPDRANVTVFVPAERAAVVAENIGENRCVAVVFSQPTTHKTFQFKADNARIVAFDPQDMEAVTRGRKTFVQELLSAGYDEEFARAISMEGSDSFVAIEFSPFAIFDQTPGATAGRRI